MTEVVSASLLLLSITVFLAHAFDAYRAHSGRQPSLITLTTASRCSQTRGPLYPVAIADTATKGAPYLRQLI